MDALKGSRDASMLEMGRIGICTSARVLRMSKENTGAAGQGAVPWLSAAKPSRAWREILPGDRAAALQDALECAGRGRVPGAYVKETS